MKITSTKLDIYGGTASLICAVHCAAMPFIITFLPLMGLSFLASETTEYILLFAATALAVTSLCAGYQKHKSLKAFPLVTMGFLLILAAHVAGHDHGHEHGHHHGNDLIEFPFALVLGGLCIAASHGINHYLCRTCIKCQAGSCGSESQ